MGRHVVVGTGTIGTALAARLAAAGDAVLAVSRRGEPSPIWRDELEGASAVEWRALDASDPGALSLATRGAEVLYNCANPPYHRWEQEWPALHESLLAAARTSGAALVTLSNLYGYGPVPHAIDESDPLAATSRKGRVRSEMWHAALAAHERGEVRATELRASDFFGPGATDGAMLGTRVVPRVLDHRTIWLLGDLDAPHSFTYTLDVVDALALAGHEERAFGRAWHVPTSAPTSVREFVRRLSGAASLPAPSVRRVPWAAVRAAGLLAPELRELRELSYQFDAPFVVDARAFTTAFGLEPTHPQAALSATVAWWRRRKGFPLPPLEVRASRP